MKKTLIICMLLIALVIETVSIAYAEDLAKQISVYFNKINITVDGEKVVADNILYNGTTYVPLRAVSEMLGKDVQYDSQTKTAIITSKNETISDLSQESSENYGLSKNIASFNTPVKKYTNCNAFLEEDENGECTEFYIPYYLLKDVANVEEDSSYTLANPVYNISPKQKYDESSIKYITPSNTYSSYMILAGMGADGKDHLYIPTDVLSGLVNFTNISTSSQYILKLSSPSTTNNSNTSTANTTVVTKPDKPVYEILTAKDTSSILKSILTQNPPPSIVDEDKTIQNKWLDKYEDTLANASATTGGRPNSYAYSTAIKTANSYINGIK